ncbi:MAG: hypothetical protein ACRDUX_37185 [Mycobacterium sp.]
MARDSDMSWDDDQDETNGDSRGLTELTVTDEEWEDEVLTLLFTATNPSGTVSVTSLISGQPVRVDLEQAATRMTERQLGNEIALVAALSQHQALASQHVLVSRFLDQLGHDPVSTRGFLERDLGLPSPDAVRDEGALLFASLNTDEPD